MRNLCKPAGQLLVYALICVAIPAGSARGEPRLRGIVENREGETFEGWIRFERDKLLLEEIAGGERQFGAAELGASHLHLAGTPAPKIPRRVPGLEGRYFRFSQFSDKNPALRVDLVIDFDWGGGGPMPGFKGDFYSIRWEGEIETLDAGKYIFHTRSNDGARLWVDGRLVVDHWESHFDAEQSGEIQLAGKRRYPIRLEHYENQGTAVMQLSWTPPGGARALVPGSQLSHVPTPFSTGAQNGLKASYFKGASLAGTPVVKVDPGIDFAWLGKAPLPGFAGVDFSVRWEGEIEAPISGPVTFHTVTDDGVRLWVGGRKLVDVWSSMGATEHRGEFPMQAGKRYPIKMEYFQAAGGSAAKLSWSGKSLPHQVIPPARLFTGAGDGTNRHAGLLLKGGSFLAGAILAVDADWIELAYRGGETLRIPRRNVGALQFRRIDPTRLRQLATMQPGCALPNGDYYESSLDRFDAGKASMVSALFGRRDFEPGELPLIKLADFERAPANFELHTRSGSRLRADWLMLDGGRAVVKDNSICWIKLDPADITAVHGIAK